MTLNPHRSSPQDKAAAPADDPLRAAPKQIRPPHRKTGGHARIVVLGALSEIAGATTRLFAREGASLLLVDEDGRRLEAVREDLLARGAKAVRTAILDLEEAAPKAATHLDDYASELGGIDHILLMYVQNGADPAMNRDPDRLQRILGLNFTSAALWCEAAASRFRLLGGGGSLVVATSVSGDRGHRRDYAYGAAHGGLTVFVQGLAHDLERVGARAVAVKLGYLGRDSPNAGAGASSARQTPEQAGAAIHKAAREGGPVVYGSPMLRMRALAVRAIPSFILHRS